MAGPCTAPGRGRLCPCGPAVSQRRVPPPPRGALGPAAGAGSGGPRSLPGPLVARRSELPVPGASSREAEIAGGQLELVVMVITCIRKVLSNNYRNVRSQPDIVGKGVNVILGMCSLGIREWENVCSTQQDRVRMF